jgi:putative transposase
MKKISYSGYRFPPEVIHQAIWLYLRFTLSLRDVEDLLAERGVAASYETVRRWVNHFGPMIAADLRKRRLKASYDLASRRGLSENRGSNGLPLAGRRR